MNHLGNVQAVISDRALPVKNGNNVSHYQADLLSATDYYPFGMTMAGRSLNTDDYRYGFNGKEFDQDWDGGRATYDYGFRIYDPRMCRFLSVDPLTKDYPGLTPFQFASNTPIWAIDLDGLEAVIVHGTMQSVDGVQFSKDNKNEFMRIGGNTQIDDKFRWNAPLLNNESMREDAAMQLVEHIQKVRAEMIQNKQITPDEGITLVGYSHGGNVAIQAAAILGNRYRAVGLTVNVITVATPAYNSENVENPSGNSGINKHIHYFDLHDMVQYAAGGNQTYHNETTDNRLVESEKGGLDSHRTMPGSVELNKALKETPSAPPAPPAGNLDW